MTARDRGRNANRNSPQQAGRDAEVAEIRRLGARLRPASGATLGRGGDGIDADYVYEHKHTGLPDFRLTTATWEKLRREAVLAGRRPVLLVLVDSTRFRVTAWSAVDHPRSDYPMVRSTSRDSTVLSRQTWGDVANLAATMGVRAMLLLDIRGLMLHVEKT